MVVVPRNRLLSGVVKRERLLIIYTWKFDSDCVKCEFDVGT